MILEAVVQNMLNTDNPAPLEREIYSRLEKLVEAVKTGDYQEAQEELFYCFWGGVTQYYRDGVKTGAQLLHEALINRG